MANVSSERGVIRVPVGEMRRFLTCSDRVAQRQLDGSIIAVHVDAIDCEQGIGTWGHIGAEVLYRSPPFADCYSAATVMAIIGVSWVETSGASCCAKRDIQMSPKGQAAHTALRRRNSLESLSAYRCEPCAACRTRIGQARRIGRERPAPRLGLEP